MGKILVTGGAGFIGSHVAEFLHNNGEDVVVVDDLSGGFKENLPRGIAFYKKSIEDYKFINKLFETEKFDYVFHLAAYAAENLSHFIKRYNYNNNLIGSVNLINASINNDIKCFVFTSSIAVYGNSVVQPVNENTRPFPEDSYGIAKLSVEEELKICREMFGLNSIIFRPHNVFGERQNIGDKYRNVIGIFMNQLLQNKPMTIYGDGKQVRSFTYVKNIVPPICGSIYNRQVYNQTFNIGDDNSMNINELAVSVARVMRKSLQVEHLDERREVKIILPSHNKSIQYFGNYSRTSFEDGLQKMAEWVKQHGSRQSEDFKDIEIKKNLPLSWRTL